MRCHASLPRLPMNWRHSCTVDVGDARSGQCVAVVLYLYCYQLHDFIMSKDLSLSFPPVCCLTVMPVE